MRYLADDKRHLVCEPYSIEALHAMAAALGIKRCWFHAGNAPHYDLPARRVDEIRNDPRVICVTQRELYEVIRTAKQRF